ncbi:relaxin receptor 2 isoform X2 [Brachionus plicatilis]|uniref:Relaxin receptor 2 isoform X2 n=1 Tax=Brachionus plicatilis TaxID=10195 RepID=A0A3M7QA80_BRAPC|nr:relaxin receptor 2 isoform X2 [Brachionus plicatilis]
MRSTNQINVGEMNSSEDINEEIYIIPKLKILNDSHFPDGDQLRILYLEDRLIEEIDKNFFKNLICLEELNLRINKIKSLDDLHFPDGNQLKIDKNFFKNLICLEELNLCDNNIESLNDLHFPDGNQLTVTRLKV